LSFVGNPESDENSRAIRPAIEAVMEIDQAQRKSQGHVGFCQRLFYHARASHLRNGRMTTRLNGEIVTEEEARRIVAHARTRGWLPE
jgi:hypothetical protein